VYNQYGDSDKLKVLFFEQATPKQSFDVYCNKNLKVKTFVLAQCKLESSLLSSALLATH